MSNLKYLEKNMCSFNNSFAVLSSAWQIHPMGQIGGVLASRTDVWHPAVHHAKGRSPASTPTALFTLTDPERLWEGQNYGIYPMTITFHFSDENKSMMSHWSPWMLSRECLRRKSHRLTCDKWLALNERVLELNVFWHSFSQWNANKTSRAPLAVLKPGGVRDRTINQKPRSNATAISEVAMACVCLKTTDPLNPPCTGWERERHKEKYRRERGRALYQCIDCCLLLSRCKQLAQITDNNKPALDHPLDESPPVVCVCISTGQPYVSLPPPLLPSSKLYPWQMVCLHLTWPYYSIMYCINCRITL